MNHEQFTREMEANGWEVEEYHGRYFYNGPAVRTNEDDPDFELQQAIRATRVPVQWDNMGNDFIVYPR